jgi:hypothetical protein
MLLLFQLIAEYIGLKPSVFGDNALLKKFENIVSREDRAAVTCRWKWTVPSLRGDFLRE